VPDTQAQEKNPNDPDTLVNLALLAGLMGKAPEVGQRSMAQLQDTSPDHPLVKALAVKEAEFDSLASNFK
jgi:coatomer protein complex subunit epsilon